MAEARPVTVIVVTHEHAAFIDRCLESLRADADAGLIRVLGIDNRSQDGTGELMAEHGHVEAMVNIERRGFAANANHGLALADSRYALLLNPDTEVMPGAIDALMAFMDDNPDVGLSGARLVYPDGTVQPSARRFPTWRTAIARRSPLRKLFRGGSWEQRHLMQDAGELSEPTGVDWLLGACLFVRLDALDRAGPLDEGFPLYVEDIEWAARMHRAGLGVVHVPEARIVHHHQGASDRRLLGRHSWLHMKGMLRYARKHWGPDLVGWRVRGEETEVWDRARRHRPPAARS